MSGDKCIAKNESIQTTLHLYQNRMLYDYQARNIRRKKRAARAALLLFAANNHSE
jgi:hypothetical protein